MKTISYKEMDEKVYYEQLESGLEVYIYSTPNVNNYSLKLMVKTGSIDTKYELDGEEINVPYGVQHFLEHLTLNTKEGTAEEFYGETGAYCNASTGFDKTIYIVESSNKLKENLTYLLNYVTSPYYTKELVEKERGIILEEVSMYDNNPYQNIYFRLLQNMLVNDNHRIKVGGSTDDVKSITLKDIENTYNCFYQKNNMALVVTGNVDPTEVLNIIHENEDSKDINNKEIKKISIKEPNNIVKEYDEMYDNVQIPKLTIGYKISKDNVSFNKDIYNKYFYILNSLLFGETSELQEELEDKNLIFGELYTSVLELDDYYILTVDAESDYIDEIIKRIEDTIENTTITASDVERKKKVIRSSIIRRFEKIESISNILIDNIYRLNGIQNDELELVSNITYEEIYNLQKEILNSPKSIIKLLPKE